MQRKAKDNTITLKKIIKVLQENTNKNQLSESYKALFEETGNSISIGHYKATLGRIKNALGYNDISITQFGNIIGDLGKSGRNKRKQIENFFDNKNSAGFYQENADKPVNEVFLKSPSLSFTEFFHAIKNSDNESNAAYNGGFNPYSDMEKVLFKSKMKEKNLASTNRNELFDEILPIIQTQLGNLYGFFKGFENVDELQIFLDNPKEYWNIYSGSNNHQDAQNKFLKPSKEISLENKNIIPQETSKKNRKRKREENLTAVKPVKTNSPVTLFYKRGEDFTPPSTRRKKPNNDNLNDVTSNNSRNNTISDMSLTLSNQNEEQDNFQQEENLSMLESSVNKSKYNFKRKSKWQNSNCLYRLNPLYDGNNDTRKFLPEDEGIKIQEKVLKKLGYNN